MKFELSKDSFRYLAIIMFIIIGGTFSYIGAISPFPVNVGVWAVLVFVIVFFVVWLAQNGRSFYAEISEDGLLVKVDAVPAIHEDLEIDQMKFYYFGTSRAKLVLSKENIISVEMASSEDVKGFTDRSATEYVITQNPVKKFKIGRELVKSLLVKEFTPGIGMFSYAFVLDSKNVIKIKLKKLYISSDLTNYTVENPIIFVSLKDPHGFISELGIE